MVEITQKDDRIKTLLEQISELRKGNKSPRPDTNITLPVKTYHRKEQLSERGEEIIQKEDVRDEYEVVKRVEVSAEHRKLDEIGKRDASPKRDDI